MYDVIPVWFGFRSRVEVVAATDKAVKRILFPSGREFEWATSGPDSTLWKVHAKKIVSIKPKTITTADANLQYGHPGLLRKSKIDEIPVNQV